MIETKRLRLGRARSALVLCCATASFHTRFVRELTSVVRLLTGCSSRLTRRAVKPRSPRSFRTGYKARFCDRLRLRRDTPSEPVRDPRALVSLLWQEPTEA